MEISPVTARQSSINWIYLIYFLSGTCSLMDEVIWVRLLKLTLGNTTYASSIVVSVFMGGLAIGALIMRQYSDRIKNHLRLYAFLELLATISALLLPWMLNIADRIYIHFFQIHNPSHGQLLIVQVMISTVLILIPSMIMGSTLPLLGRFVTLLVSEAGHLVGKLYAINTLGAAVGCFLAGFVFIRIYGVMGTLYIAAGLNFFVSLSGYILSKRYTLSTVVSTQVFAPSGMIGAGKYDPRFGLLVLAFFTSGLISIGFELLWMRSIVHLIGGVTYVFSAVLTIYLVGNVIGTIIGSRLVKKTEAPAAGFAGTLFFLGLSGILYLPTLIIWASKVLPSINQSFISTNGQMKGLSFIIGPLIHSVGLFLLPAIVMGIGFPFAIQAWANHINMVGRSTGTAYGANTFGAVIGGIVTGFVLLPQLGLQVSIVMLGLMGIWMAALICIAFVNKANIIGRFSILILAILITVTSRMGPCNLFESVVLLNPTLPKQLELVSMKEGAATTVALYRNIGDNSLNLHSSGQGIAGDSPADRSDQKMLGHFGVMLNKKSQKILSVGFGSGETTACLSRHSLGRIDCVEIAPEIMEISLKYFSHINLGEKLEEEVNMIFMDAKNYIHLTAETYDVIVNDSIHPRDFAENSSLYSKEYFEDAKTKLNSNGIILSWVPTYDMPSSVFDSIIGTFMDVYPYVTMWYMTPHPTPLVLIVGSMQQQYYSPKYITEQLKSDCVRESLEGINVFDSHDFFSCYVADEKDLQKVITGYTINSDYKPFVEFVTDKCTPQSDIFKRYVLGIRNNSFYNHIDWTGYSEKEKDKWQQDNQKTYNAMTHLLWAYDSVDPMDMLQYSMEGLAILPNNNPLITFRDKAEKKMYSVGVNLIVSGKADIAQAMALHILTINPKSPYAWMIRAAARQSVGDIKLALQAANISLMIAPDNSDVHSNMGFVLFAAKRHREAIEEYKKALAISQNAPDVLQILAEIMIMDNTSDFYNPIESIRLAKHACELTGYKELKMLKTLEKAYTAAGWHADAVEIGKKALK